VEKSKKSHSFSLLNNENAGSVGFCIITLFSSNQLMKKPFWDFWLSCAENVIFRTLKHFGMKTNVEFFRLFYAEIKIFSILEHFRVKKNVLKFSELFGGFITENIFRRDKVYLKIREKRWEYDDSSNGYTANIETNTERISWFWN
jgi:hypothetical protein